MKWTLGLEDHRELLRTLCAERDVRVGAGSASASYRLVPKYDGRPRRFVDVYYDVDGRLEQNHALVRHRTVWATDVPDHHPLHFSRLCSEAELPLASLDEGASWMQKREQVQYKQTTTRVEATWFRTEAGKCTISGGDDEEPRCEGYSADPEEVVRGAHPRHPTSARLRREFPGLVQSSLIPARRIEQHRFRVALEPQRASRPAEQASAPVDCPAFPVRLSIDLVTISDLPNGATRGPIAELELEFDPDRELRYLSVECVKRTMSAVADWLGTIATLEPSDQTKGGIRVPDRCELDDCETELAVGEPDPESEPDPQARARARSRRSERNGRAIWCGTPSELPSIEDLALRAAPILWFSPNEPLLHENQWNCDPLPETISIPWGWEPGECARRVVYYRVERIDDRDPSLDPRSYGTTPVPLAHGSELSLRYFFYYPRDAGTNAHLCDLESVYFEITIDELVPSGPPETPRYRANLTYVKAAAHGLNWVANRLRIAQRAYGRASAPDTLLPVTILVEEGKHGSGTDRNGDGVFTPGYDVNAMVTDAWGIRDTFGSGLLKRFYTPEQTKPRRPEHRIFPDLPRLSALRARYETRYTWNEAGTYTLRPAVPPSSLDGKEYECVEPSKKETTVWVSAMDRLPVSWRYDGNKTLSVVTVPVSLGSVYATPRLIVSKGPRPLRGSGVQLTPSLARWLDWYGAVGWQAITDDADVSDSSIFRDAFTYEFGARFRFKPLWLNEHLPFIGARIGLRIEGFLRPGRSHLVFEIGGGFQ